MSDFLNNYGDIMHCYETHKRVMQEKGLPYLTYGGFRRRIASGWPVYQAIHTPAEWTKPKKSKWQKLRARLINLFKRN